ncbi:MAG: hypothetical protein HDR23_03140 [Lachnospiraceae bacterium]|nr:hypothetical protein [Lachnospiraceae bacterium]
MKDEFQDRRNRWGDFAGRSLMTLILVFAVIAAIPFLSNAADRFDARKCSLTVKAIGEYQESLAYSDLVIDLYKIADASPYPGSDGYFFSLDQVYADLVIGNDMKGEDWSRIAQMAAEIALSGDSKQVPVKQLDFNIQSENDLDAGLYLLIARNKDAKVEDYVDHVTVTDDEEKTESKIVTKAYVDEYIYTFSPELVALPSKPEEAGVINTANSGDWIFDMEVFLKPEQNARYGALKIIKTLKNYNASNGPATFVFDVEAVWKDKNVYSNVVSVVFNDPGVKEIIVEKIPVGAEVTVTEVYTGASYKLITEKEQTAVITEDMVDPSFVSFTNDYDERQNGGHSITNCFKYEVEENPETDTDTNTKLRLGEWKLEQLYDMSQNEEDS